MNKVKSDKQSIQAIIDSFERYTDEIFTLEGIRKFLTSGRQLRLKYGVDATAPDLHIGHAV
jgi:tyrosyl-tRNA synthetase